MWGGLPKLPKSGGQPPDIAVGWSGQSRPFLALRETSPAGTLISISDLPD